MQRLGSDTDDDDDEDMVCSSSKRVSTALAPQFVERSSIRMVRVLDPLSDGKKCFWTSSAMRDSARFGVIFGAREAHCGCEAIAAAIAGVEWPLPPTRIRVWTLLGARERWVRTWSSCERICDMHRIMQSVGKHFERSV